MKNETINKRPILNNTLNSTTFQNYYYLKKELIEFCRQEGLQAIGSKIELTNRISHYLDTGEKIVNKTPIRRTNNTEIITNETIIEDNFVCSEKHRAFFIQIIGKGFSFNVPFQKWLRSNTGKTYNEAIEAYHQILVEKKNSKTEIDKQFEYNTYIRDFFANNKVEGLVNAIKCWKYKKRLQGSNKYKKTDLIALRSSKGKT